MAEIALRGVRKSYGKTEVVHGVDLHIAHGELVVILGPSGCGKARSPLAARSSTSSSRVSAAAPWCSRTTRSIRI